MSTSTLRSNSSFSNLAAGKRVVASPQTQKTTSSKSSETPIQNFKFKPTNLSEVGLLKKHTPTVKLKVPTPSVVAFGKSFSCQTPTDLTNNNLNTPKVYPRTRGSARQINESLDISANGGRTSPKNSSRQRGVLLPLLKEKDTIISQLEETVSTFQEKVSACKCDSLEQIKGENHNLKKSKKDLDEKVKMLLIEKNSLQEEVDNLQEKMFDLETKNMILIKSLESEQAHVESLQAETDRLIIENGKLGVNNSGDSGSGEEDIESLVETFVERLGLLCRDQSLKMSISSRNIKLSIRTRAEPPSSQATTPSSSTERLESTHLCEPEADVRRPRCRSFGQFAALQEAEEEEEDIKSSMKRDDNLKEDVRKKASSKPKSRKEKVLSPTMGEKMGKLRLNENKPCDASETRLTRSMARNRSVSMTKEN